jgi:hypothetical protein
MTVTRIILSAIACFACFSAAFVVTRYRQSWVILGGASFWVFAGNVMRLQFDIWGDHWLRWAPFYWLVTIAAVVAVVETYQYRRRR